MRNGTKTLLTNFWGNTRAQLMPVLGGSLSSTVALFLTYGLLFIPLTLTCYCCISVSASGAPVLLNVNLWLPFAHAFFAIFTTEFCDMLV